VGLDFDENRFTPILLEKVPSWPSAIPVHIGNDQFDPFSGKGQGGGTADTCHTSSDTEVCWSLAWLITSPLYIRVPSDDQCEWPYPKTDI
jgi:hypothetical protein